MALAARTRAGRPIWAAFALLLLASHFAWGVSAADEGEVPVVQGVGAGKDVLTDASGDADAGAKPAAASAGAGAREDPAGAGVPVSQKAKARAAAMEVDPEAAFAEVLLQGGIQKHTPVHCDDEDCFAGKCSFTHCRSPVRCSGGRCVFTQCTAPSCSGGMCTFIECESPTCGGGGCDFFDTQSTLRDGYCDGGACRIDGHDAPSKLTDDLVF